MTLQITFIGGKIDPVEAKNRCIRFGKIKKSDVETGIGVIQDDVIQYDVKAFLSMLQEMIKYNDITGIKVYYACYDPANPVDVAYIPANKNGMLTLIFVPTIEKKGSLLYDNLTKDYYIMNKTGDGFVNLNKPPQPNGLASRWVGTYQGDVLPNLLNGMDTKSTWYELQEVLETIKVINEGINNQTINSMLYSFASYKKGDKIDRTLANGQRIKVDIDNKLSGIFWFGIDLKSDNFMEIIHGDGTFEKALAYKNNEPEKFEKKFRLLADPDPYDTGIPIPPASGVDPQLP